MYRMKTNHWHLNRVVHLIAGLLSLTGLALGFLLHTGFFLVPFFVGFMQLFYSVTGYCPMAILLHYLGVHEQ